MRRDAYGMVPARPGAARRVRRARRARGRRARRAPSLGGDPGPVRRGAALHGAPGAPTSLPREAPRLRILAPRFVFRLVRAPETPAGMTTLALRALVEPRAE